MFSSLLCHIHRLGFVLRMASLLVIRLIPECQMSSLQWHQATETRTFLCCEGTSPGASRRAPLTSLWLELGHMATAKPISDGEKRWLQPISIHPGVTWRGMTIHTQSGFNASGKGSGLGSGIQVCLPEKTSDALKITSKLIEA